jgi:hypothetical protein
MYLEEIWGGRRWSTEYVLIFVIIHCDQLSMYCTQCVKDKDLPNMEAKGSPAGSYLRHHSIFFTKSFFTNVTLVACE